MIILSSRITSPRNLMSRVISCGAVERVILQEAQEFYTMACRPTVGYKQIASMFDLDIQADSSFIAEVLPKEEEPKMENSITSRFKINRERKVYDVTNPATRKKIEDVVVETPTIADIIAMSQVDTFADFSEVVQPVNNEPVQLVTFEQSVEDFSMTTMDFNLFVNEIQKGLELKKTRGRADVDGVVKAVWRRFKDDLEGANKQAAKQFCIEVHNSFNQLMDEQPRHWFFIPVATYTNGYFQEAISRCIP